MFRIDRVDERPSPGLKLIEPYGLGVPNHGHAVGNLSFLDEFLRTRLAPHGDKGDPRTDN
jgi:hypothetical protein